MKQRTITFIGAGNMAKAIIVGLVKQGYPAQLMTVSAPSATHRNALAQELGVNSQHDNIMASQQADVIVLAVKPQLMAEVCAQLKTQVNFKNKLIISIAAGVTLHRFQQLLGDNINLIRIMPNTPSLVGKGMSGLFADNKVSESDRLFATQLMQSVGEICWVKHEQQINDIIAVSGSGPAYVFLFMQAMQQEALNLGFDQNQARLLVQQTVLGAAQLVAATPQLSLGQLREQVTSKGGTTAEAIRVLNEEHLTEIVAKAMNAAILRAKDMEKLF